MDSVADRTHTLSSRAAELQAGFARMLDAFERLGLVALNAGLEGARLGESEGRALGPRQRGSPRAFVAWRGRGARPRSRHRAARRGAHAARVAGGPGADRRRGGDAGLCARCRRRKRRRGGAHRHRRPRQEGDGQRSGGSARHRGGQRARASARRDALGAQREGAARPMLLSALRPAIEPLARLLGEEEREGEPEGE